jgi:hypothetical protein
MRDKDLATLAMPAQPRSLRIGVEAGELRGATLVATTERLGADRIVHRLEAGDAWRPLIEAITQFKLRLDRVLNRAAWLAGAVAGDDIAWAAALGFECSEAPSGINPEAFLALIVGPFRARCEPRFSPRLSRIPPWAAVGWQRRRHQAFDAADARARRAAIDAETIAHGDGSGRWLRPLPLVICGEGKHRTQLHAQFFDDLLANLEATDLPRPGALRLRRVLGAPQLLALQCRGEAGWETALLPFPALSLPLFAALGVVPRGWWIAAPWSPPLRTIVNRMRRMAPFPTRFALAMWPARLHTALLEASYV